MNTKMCSTQAPVQRALTAPQGQSRRKRLFSGVVAGLGFTAFFLVSVSALAANAPPLGTADSFGVLAASAVSNTGASVINGDLGISPNNMSSITGFPPGSVTGTIHAADGVAAQAQLDTTTAYNNLAGQASNADLTGQDLGGMTLTPGVYSFSSSAQLTGNLFLDFLGNTSSEFVFQIGSSFTTASNSSVSVVNGEPGNGVYWQVGSSATLGTGTSLLGSVIADQSVTLATGASILCGRAIALNAAVTMDGNTISTDCLDLGGVTPVPEPTTLALLLGPLVAIGFARRARRSASKATPIV